MSDILAAIEEARRKPAKEPVYLDHEREEVKRILLDLPRKIREGDDYISLCRWRKRDRLGGPYCITSLEGVPRLLMDEIKKSCNTSSEVITDEDFVISHENFDPLDAYDAGYVLYLIVRK